MITRLPSSMRSALGCLLMLGAAPSLLCAADLAEVARANARNSDAVQAAIVTYERIENRPSWAERAKRDIPSFSDDDLLYMNLRETASTEETLSFDKRSGNWRLDVRDTRDLAKILSDKGIPAEKASDYSQTRTVVGGRRDHLLILKPVAGGHSLSIVPLPPRANKKLPVFFGDFNQDLLIGQADITATEDEWQSCPSVKIVRRIAQTEVELQLDPAAGMRYRKLVRMEQGERIGERVLSDYRRIGDVFVPFRQEERFWDGKGHLSIERISVLNRIELNPAVPPSFSLSLSPPTVVLNAVRGYGGQMIKDPMVLEYDSAPEVLANRGKKSSATAPGN